MFCVCSLGLSWTALSLYSRPDRRFCLSTVQPRVLNAARTRWPSKSICRQYRQLNMITVLCPSSLLAFHSYSFFISFLLSVSTFAFLSYSLFIFLWCICNPKISRGKHLSSVCGLASKPNGHWLALFLGGNRSNMCRLWNLGQVNKTLWGFSGTFLLHSSGFGRSCSFKGVRFVLPGFFCTKNVCSPKITIII